VRVAEQGGGDVGDAVPVTELGHIRLWDRLPAVASNNDTDAPDRRLVQRFVVVRYFSRMRGR